MNCDYFSQRIYCQNFLIENQNKQKNVLITVYFIEQMNQNCNQIMGKNWD
jgi:hypothetical protein